MLTLQSPQEALRPPKFHAERRACSPHILLTKRYSRVLLGSFLFLSALFVLLKIQGTNSYRPFVDYQAYPPYPQSNTLEAQNLPPIYEKWHEYERQLPQHDLTLPPPEGEAAKFIFMANHAVGSGWGNILQEMIFNAHLAYSTKRAFVFDNYTWDRHESDYSEFNGKAIPSRVPVSTMLIGPIIGGSFGPNSDVPRAVSREYFRKVCPEPTVINSDDIKRKLNKDSGETVMNGWIENINSLKDRCIEIDQNSEHLFDIWLFGDKKILPVFPLLRQSPIITQFGFSPLIMSAYTVNKGLFVPSASSAVSFFSNFLLSFLFGSRHNSDSPIIVGSEPIPGLLTIHIRRGDFEAHCVNLETWNSQFTGFNSFPELLDKLHYEPENKLEEFRKHCYPTPEEIVRKVNEVRRDTRMHVKASRENVRNSAKWKNYTMGTGDEELKRIYVMTNAPERWLKELKKALKDSEAKGEEPWEAIHTSRDLMLTWEQKYVAQSVDMYVAMRSQSFIGNGFSSLTSNIILMRMANDINPIYSRLW